MHHAIVFDLDGVLVDSKEIHFNALNLALGDVDQKFIISKIEQDTTFEGLTTKTKLDILSHTKGLPKEIHNEIWLRKQKYSAIMFESLGKDNELVQCFKVLKDNNIKIGVASNSIRQTLDTCLKAIGVADFVDVSLSNEDVENPKPNPEIYLKAISMLGSSPEYTVIIEDSEVGIKAARQSGSNTVKIGSRANISLELILDIIKNYRPKLNVLIPMAGLGSRFANAGYELPKPLIDVNGKPMIQRVVENISIPANYTFLVQKEHYEKYDLGKLLTSLTPHCNILMVDGLTDGAAVTTLIAKDIIDNEMPLIIVNSDQLVDWDPVVFKNLVCNSKADGVIALFNSSDPKWSYANITDGIVSSVAEKLVISNNASVGIYGWKRGSDYVKYAEQMINLNIKTNNEFYICPVYNRAIFDSKIIYPYFVDEMYGLGTPEDLEEYIAKNRS